MSRKKSREQAFQLIFARSLCHDPIRQIVDTAEMSDDIRIDESAEKAACGVEEKEALLDDEIRKYIRGWKLERLSKVSLSLLRLAFYEMRFVDDIPEDISISEAVRLAKKFGGASDAPFVNGVLGTAVREKGKKQSG